MSTPILPNGRSNTQTYRLPLPRKPHFASDASDDRYVVSVRQRDDCTAVPQALANLCKADNQA